VTQTELQLISLNTTNTQSKTLPKPLFSNKKRFQCEKKTSG